ncbi:MAG: FG-GAP repeat domain-containing protein [Akkermansiaceae bacterium]
MPLYLALLSSLLLLASCKNSDNSEDSANAQSEAATRIRNGEQLARIHCATCHSFPEPALLTKRSWKFLLAYMGLRMGVEDLSLLENAKPAELDMFRNLKKLAALEGKIPTAPMVTEDQWIAVRDYYLQAAPAISLPQATKPELYAGLDLFQPSPHAYDLKFPITSLIFIDESNEEILIGDSGYDRLTALDRNLKVQTDYDTKGYLWVQAEQKNDGVYLLSIGDLMGGYATNKLGKISYGVRQGSQYANKGIALGGLHRPAAMAFGDFDNDNKDEIVVANFGFANGSVDVHKVMANGWQFEQEPSVTLSTDPSPVDCKVEDFNQDGLNDVAVLFGGARENLSLFLNRGNGKFERKILIEQHAAFGYVRFKWMDFDSDGDLDVITVNGDNFDSTPYNTLKPYHGIRLYLNQGDLTFTESYFHPMYGAYGVEVQDFDQDGDLDLAAISFNPDFDSTRNESFVYLENQGETRFETKTIDMPKTDRWMTIASGDIDSDGDKDLILGGSYVPAGLSVDNPELMKQMKEKGRPLIILENKTR